MALQRYNLENPIEYEGLVLSLREKNGYHDSDFYAIVWDSESQTPKTVYYHTTRGYSLGWANVDATEETKKAFDKWKKQKQKRKAEINKLKKELVVRKNNVVEIFRGRKRKGEIGTVFWIGKGAYIDYVRVSDHKKIQQKIDKIAYGN